MNSRFSTLTALLLCVCAAAYGSGRKVLVAGDCGLEPEVRAHLAALAETAGHSLDIRQVPADSVCMLRRQGWTDLVVSRSDAAAVLAKRHPHCRTYILQDWAYARSYSKEPASDPRFAAYGYDQKRMYRTITDETGTLCSRYRAGVIPVGTAVQNIRATQDRDNITRDGVSLNYNIGSYAAACTWFEAIFGEDVTTVPYDPGRLSPFRKAVAAGGAHAAVHNPWEVSDYGFRSLSRNYDESSVPQYVLPEALVMQDGTAVTDPGQWYEQRRPELLSLFESEMYGRAPGRLEGMHFRQISYDDEALGGKAVRKEVKIFFTADEERYMTLLIYLPKNEDGPVPVVLGANFMGNASVIDDPGITMPDSLQVLRYGVYLEPERGEMAGRWPVELILSRGYGLATFFKGDLDPDFDDSYTNGVHPLFYPEGRTYPEPDECGSIGAWAWGYSRALDYLETDPDVDASRVSAVGHSRLGKTALWAAVTDTRFAMAFPNNSGCGGAAISRRAFGETIEAITMHYQYWFCANLQKYSGNEAALPFDQHELIALMAPRPVYLTSGSEDLWSDPRGEFISVREASKVYEFLGLEGLGRVDAPEVWEPCNTGLVGYHIRGGVHDITAYDWSCFLDFADRFLKPASLD